MEGAAEENRLNQKTEAESIAHKNWKNVELIDPLTNMPIHNLKKIMDDNQMRSIDSIYI